MPPANRKLWSYKPKQYGPWKFVHRSLFHNAERMGIDPASILLANPFWSGAGATIQDYSGNRSNGTVTKVGNVYGGEWDTGPGGLAMDLYGFADQKATYILHPNVQDPFNGGSNQVTVSMLCYFEDRASVNDIGLFAMGDSTTSWRAVLSRSSNFTPKFTAPGKKDYTFTYEFPLNELTSITFTFDESYDVSLFINGVFKQKVTGSSAPQTPAGDFVVGGTSSTTVWSGDIYSFVMLSQVLSPSKIALLSDNPYQLWQPVPQKTYFLPQEVGGVTLIAQDIAQSQSIDNIDLIQQHILSINPINQAQSIDNIILQAGITLSINGIDQSQTIDNIDLIQANVLSINELNQNQTLDNITLSLSVLLQIADIAQSQNIDIVNLIQQNILSINGIDQAQTLDNIDLIQANLLSIDPIDQSQTLDNIFLETGVLLQIAGIAQSQIIDNIDMIQQNILSVLDIDQNQDIDNLDLTQANILAIADMTQQQIIDNIVLSITRIEGKISLTFVLSAPGISKTLTSPGANFTGE